MINRLITILIVLVALWVAVALFTSLIVPFVMGFFSVFV
ncbi:MAG: hypothetical protein DDT26_01946 [Dehalococcoidia bacterium]|nr:hypothetical protein [Chloroflexota bacterium]